MTKKKSDVRAVVRGKDGCLQHIAQAARDLGVSRQHLRLVLIGERKSPPLMARISNIHPELLELFNVAN